MDDRRRLQSLELVRRSRSHLRTEESAKLRAAAELERAEDAERQARYVRLDDALNAWALHVQSARPAPELIHDLGRVVLARQAELERQADLTLRARRKTAVQRELLAAKDAQLKQIDAAVKRARRRCLRIAEERALRVAEERFTQRGYLK